MRKSYLVASVAALVLLLTHKSAEAQATVTDYFTFSNKSAETWVASTPILGPGEAIINAGQTPVSAGYGSNGDYSAPANSGSSFQIVWSVSNNPSKTCTVKSSATYSSTYGTWEFKVSGVASGGNQKCGPVQAEANNTTSPAYTFYYTISD